jgi:hypothetical protein
VRFRFLALTLKIFRCTSNELVQFGRVMLAADRITIAGVKLGSVFANLASIASLALYLHGRASSSPAKSTHR